MRFFVELLAPIIAFFLSSALATFTHCRLTLRGWGTFRRVVVTWAVSAASLYVTTLHFHEDLLFQIAVLTFFGPTLIAEKAVRYPWFKENVDPRYPIGLCCGLFVAAAGIYLALSYDFIPTNEYVPQQFRNLQMTFWTIVVLFIPLLVACVPSRNFLPYAILGLVIPLLPIQSLPLSSFTDHLLAFVAATIPFGVFGAALELLPIPGSLLGTRPNSKSS